MSKSINCLSLFDGMSGCHIALDKAGIKVGNYYASEIDKYAKTVTQHNYPDTIEMGSVTNWNDWDIDWSSIDLVTCGFPCQSWSLAGKQLGDKDERGMLFWTMLDVIKNVLHHNPKAKFLMENVKMKKEFEQYITKHTEEALGHVNKILINSALVSAQNRNRWYWSNIEGITQPEDKGIVLRDILETDIDSSYNLSESNMKTYSRAFGSKGKNLTNKKNSTLLQHFKAVVIFHLSKDHVILKNLTVTLYVTTSQLLQILKAMIVSKEFMQKVVSRQR